MKKMNKKTRNLAATAVFALIVAVAAIVIWHFYQESNKSGLEKAAGKTVDWSENAVDKTAKATKKLLK